MNYLQIWLFNTVKFLNVVFIHEKLWKSQLQADKEKELL
jgi:uncharacterized membrane protein